MISRVQAELEALYDLQCESRAEAYVVDHATALDLGAAGHAEEELLVLEDARGLEVALYLSPALLARLAPHEGREAQVLEGPRLSDYCQLAEGVSHFLYLSHTADQARQVSLLELEAQAEVDKFALCVLLRWGEGVGPFAQRLWGRLFEQVDFRAHLSADERWRYEEANRLGRRYCANLLPAIRARRREVLVNELRYSYRLGAEAKLAYLARVH